MHRRADTRTD